MFINIFKYLKSILQYSNFYCEDKEKEKDEKVNKVEVMHILCLIYVLQLILKALLSNV